MRPFLALLGFALASASFAQTPSTELTKQIGFTQLLGAQVPAEVLLTNESGQKVPFKSVFKGRPVLLVPIFYSCQTGCAVITENLMKTLAKATRGDSAIVGQDFDIVFLSIKPTETADLARRRKNVFVDAYNRPDSAPAWTLFTGDEASVRKITDAIGFRYTWDAKSDRINHPAGVVILSPTLQVSSYIIGTQFPTKVLEDDIDRAAKNEVGPKTDEFLFGCIMLDPATGKRRIVIERIVRIAGVITLIALVASIVKMSLGGRRADAV